MYVCVLHTSAVQNAPRAAAAASCAAMRHRMSSSIASRPKITAQCDALASWSAFAFTWRCVRLFATMHFRWCLLFHARHHVCVRKLCIVACLYLLLRNAMRQMHERNCIAIYGHACDAASAARALFISHVKFK